MKVLTTVVSRLILERLKTDITDRATAPVHLILDEAHRYIKAHDRNLLGNNIFETIAREGRKYGCILGVSSQKPSELSQVVLSQCQNYIIHKTVNKMDLDFISQTIPYYSSDFALKIKNFLPGEAIIFGNSVSMPLTAKINKPNPEPTSANANIPKAWFIDSKDYTYPFK